MKAIGRPWCRPFLNNNLVRYSSTSPVNKDDNQSAAYPPILDLSEDALKRRSRQSLFDKYRELHTVEEKLFVLNLPKYYGWNSLILKEGEYPYNVLPFAQHVTRTRHFRGTIDSLYKVLGKEKDECKEILEQIRPEIQEAVLFELKGRRWQFESDSSKKKLSDSNLQNIVGKNIVHQINSIILSALSSHHAYLLNSITDYEPRVEGFWTVGSFLPSEEELSQREEEKKKKQGSSKDVVLTDEEKCLPVEHWIQYFGLPCLQLRTDLPLPVLDTLALETSSVGSADSAEEGAMQPPHMTHDPVAAYGLTMERRHGTSIPGYWPGEKNEFGLLSYHLSGHLLDRPPEFGQDEAADTLSAQAILASFSWLLAQASYQGFSTFHEVTYPLVNQCIVTDGHYFSPHVYQLNTLLLHSDNIVANPRTNISLALPYKPLYNEIQDNQFIGWNDDVLESLLLMYLNKPAERKGVNLKPYLHPEQRYIADTEDNERRAWLHDQFRHMYSNRPRCRLPYEIYDWERIYKIKFETRPMDARLRPFELDCNPLEDRKYYQHMHKYIPRAQRTRKKHWTNWRAKFSKTYYPEINFE